MTRITTALNQLSATGRLGMGVVEQMRTDEQMNQYRTSLFHENLIANHHLHLPSAKIRFSASRPLKTLAHQKRAYFGPSRIFKYRSEMDMTWTCYFCTGTKEHPRAEQVCLRPPDVLQGSFFENIHFIFCAYASVLVTMHTYTEDSVEKRKQINRPA